MRRQQLVGILVAFALVAAVAAIVITKTCCGSSPTPAAQTTVTGLIGSEKADFFASPEVQRAFSKLGLTVSVQHAGSWQMKNELKGGSYDFAIPASSVAADSIPTAITTTKVRPFYSPLVVLTTPDVAAFMKQNGLASQKDKVWVMDMQAYWAAASAGTAWTGLPRQENRPAGLSGQIYIATTDPRSSSSASLYLALMSYLGNGQKVVASQSDIDRVGPALQKLMGYQGAMLSSSDQLFRDFVAGTERPLSWTYESEVAEQALAGTLPAGSTVIYPDYDIQSDHTVVELTAKAARVSAALATDPDLVKLEARFGFRPESDPGLLAKDLQQKDNQQFPADLKSLGTSQPPPPTSDLLQQLVNRAVPSGQ
ncbi:hypothetical protein E6W39_31095 [Kitasatospora acidiphila]|uniref:ABC transporter substrate-binding protein n=1 Tax=Kitasatospora acidiphila TaxID=2567942 RepID=A0A540WA16_9ACTN|nr:hypothetical protein [Kitasatospora acidiphila]TQF05869.1 hypothetical protein E6W39_31095 [Kitasatospora acidiphila]